MYYEEIYESYDSRHRSSNATAKLGISNATCGVIFYNCGWESDVATLLVVRLIAYAHDKRESTEGYEVL